LSGPVDRRTAELIAFLTFAPVKRAGGAMFSARDRMARGGAPIGETPVPEWELCQDA